MATMSVNKTTKDPARTRLLLQAGIMITPWFLGLSLIQAFARPGFDLTKHEVSLLLVGSFGWVQVINFLVTGLAGICFAFGLRRLLHPGKAGTWGPILLGVYGVCFFIAGLFHPDPQLDFPVGAPGGIPIPASLPANIHSLAFSLLALAIVAACFVFARKFNADGKRGWMIYCIANAVAILVLIALGGALMSGGQGGLPLLGVAIAISSWISAVALHLLRGLQA